jgi:hypothetical protein
MSHRFSVKHAVGLLALRGYPKRKHSGNMW